MPRDFEELDFAPTPMGDLVLQRRRVRMLGDLDVFEVKLGDAYLMSSLFHVAEEALADLCLANVPAPDVVVGGLGLGYTAAAALAYVDVESLLVVDALPTVIGWHRRGLVPLGETLTRDERCRLIEGNFFALAADPARGFDPDRPGRKFHAVLLDVDHSPRNLLDPSHAPFYEVAGLRTLAAQMHPGGTFGLWSDDPPDDAFLNNLRAVFATAEAHSVPFENPLLGKESASTVYVARLAL